MPPAGPWGWSTGEPGQQEEAGSWQHHALTAKPHTGPAFTQAGEAPDTLLELCNRKNLAAQEVAPLLQSILPRF